MATIGDIDELHTQLPGSFFEATRLVTQLCSEQQQALGWIVCGL
jgi:hypothetical protein